MKMTYPKAAILSVLAALLAGLAGCGAVPLRMKATVEPKFFASVSPALGSKRFRKILLLPPTGTRSSAFKRETEILESRFGAAGIPVVRGAVKGKVTVPSGLEAARKAGADGLLLVSRYGWTPTRPQTRFFILDDSKEEKAFREVRAQDFKAWTGKKVGYRSDSLHLNGALVDVMTGKTLASVQVVAHTNGSLPQDYVAEFNPDGMPTSETFKYGKRSRVRGGGAYVFEPTGTWVGGAKEKTVETVFGMVAAKILEHLE
jgi:hypothetical protein